MFFRYLCENGGALQTGTPTGAASAHNKKNIWNMADNYLGRKMEEYLSRPDTAKHKASHTLARLLRKNRSCRGYDAGFKVREDQLRKIIGVNTSVASSRNRQALRFRPVLADEAPKVLEHVRMGGALPELHLPLPGTEPNAFIVVCTTAAPDDDLYIDVGISAQSMLLQAVEIGLNGLCIRAFDREGIKRALGLTLEPVLVMALGRSVEKAETVEIPADGNHAYYRRDGRHYVPKVRAEELIIPHACGQQH